MQDSTKQILFDIYFLIFYPEVDLPSRKYLSFFVTFPSCFQGAQLLYHKNSVNALPSPNNLASATGRVKSFPCLFALHFSIGSKRKSTYQFHRATTCSDLCDYEESTENRNFAEYGTNRSCPHYRNPRNDMFQYIEQCKIRDP